jgi:hypothetical protein
VLLLTVTFANMIFGIVVDIVDVVGQVMLSALLDREEKGRRAMIDARGLVW